jgi:hypothetical protein
MKNSRIGFVLSALALVTLVVGAAPAVADGKKLVKGLAGDLGITEDQAIGGTRALLDVAKGNLGEDGFKQLLDGSPELGDILGDDHKMAKAAAGAMAGGDTMEKVKEMAGEGGGLAALAGNADLVQKFSDLGMDSSMIEKLASGLLDKLGGGGPGSGLGNPKTKLLRKGLGIL